MRFGILGGSFDPIHNGHLSLAKVAEKELSLDKILFVPAWQAPHKLNCSYKSDIKKLENSKHRLKMLELAIQGFKNYEICTFELEKKKISYTVNTLYYLKERYPEVEFYLLIGQDNYLIFDKWYASQKILELCKIVVFKRQGYLQSVAFPFLSVKKELPNISSNEIRHKVLNNSVIENDVPESVEKYITENVLYKNKKELNA